jgi:hypothetical protein
MITAAIMMLTCSAMPTAVITESSENTMSRIRIWMMTEVNEAAARAVPAPSSPSSLQNQVPAGDLVVQCGKERRRQPHHPRDGQQQAKPGDHRQRQAQAAGPLTLLFAELTGEDRDEDDVVDAEDDLEHRQRQKGHPALDAGHPIEHQGFSDSVAS